MVVHWTKDGPKKKQMPIVYDVETIVIARCGECGSKLKESRTRYTCPRCGTRYKKKPEEIEPTEYE